MHPVEDHEARISRKEQLDKLVKGRTRYTNGGPDLQQLNCLQVVIEVVQFERGLGGLNDRQD